MTEEKKGIVRMLAITFVVMLAIPLAYRVWITFNPPAPRERLSLAEFFDKATANRSVRLLKTPIDQWTKTDRAAEPKIAAWLEAHSKIVLPWEWSSEAQKKDPKGYRKAWEKLLDEAVSVLERSIKHKRKELKNLEREIWINRSLYSHLTNQFAKVEGVLATNPPPVTVTVEHLAKGRLWGWNRRLKQVRLESETNRIEFVSGITAETEELQKEHGRLESSGKIARVTVSRLESILSENTRNSKALDQVGNTNAKRRDELVLTFLKGLTASINEGRLK